MEARNPSALTCISVNKQCIQSKCMQHSNRKPPFVTVLSKGKRISSEFNVYILSKGGVAVDQL